MGAVKDICPCVQDTVGQGLTGSQETDLEKVEWELYEKNPRIKQAANAAGCGGRKRASLSLQI